MIVGFRLYSIDTIRPEVVIRLIYHVLACLLGALDKMMDVISNICLMPTDFRTNGKKSMIQLLKESGYLGHENAITKDDIKRFLTDHPDLIESWETYSSDKRVSEGWYLLHEESVWIVGYETAITKPGGREKKRYSFSSASEACAVFIVNELRQMADNAS
ncbi:hypothetical protein EG834_03310 [bacterium]|nr:hypothetical protein [bacterium]